MKWLNPQQEPDDWSEERERILEPWPVWPPHPPIEWLNLNARYVRLRMTLREENADAN